MVSVVLTHNYATVIVLPQEYNLTKYLWLLLGVGIG